MAPEPKSFGATLAPDCAARATIGARAKDGASFGARANTGAITGARLWRQSHWWCKLWRHIGASFGAKPCLGRAAKEKQKPAVEIPEKLEWHGHSGLASWQELTD